ncbi:MAG: hypothetical protein ABFS34_02945 [Gemmatimonadota bacterium]
MKTARLVACALCLAACSMVAGTLAAQEPTQVLVRVVANDAKIIGTGVGGASISIRDAETGALLAEGVQQGSTGNTAKIMGPRGRGESVFDTEGAAGFLAELSLARPTLVEIRGTGPLGAETQHTTTKTLLVVPGRHVVGEGVILVLNGFTVELQEPTQDSVQVGVPFHVRASVTMLCGCPTEPGGTWDSDGYEISARLVRGSDVIGEWPLSFSGERSLYAAEISAQEAGDFELQVIATDARTANFGMTTRRISVRR